MRPSTARNVVPTRSRVRELESSKQTVMNATTKVSMLGKRLGGIDVSNRHTMDMIDTHAHMSNA